ncbi:MAG: hypothetical protein KatS3mg059_0689 [Thermomicrobiales bacterium]|nr:MAG: hypothetical protein KatS3mg059_0689 [Thermomicrobiales bacterium]
MQLNVVIAFEPGVDPLVMVVDSNGEDLLGAVLADDVLVELLVELAWGRDARQSRLRTRRLWLLFLDDLTAELDTLVADIHLVWAGNQPANFFLPFVAKGTPVMHPPTSRTAAHLVLNAGHAGSCWGDARGGSGGLWWRAPLVSPSLPACSQLSAIGYRLALALPSTSAPLVVTTSPIL